MANPQSANSNFMDHSDTDLERQAARGFANRLKARAGEVSKIASEIARAAGIKRGAMTGYWAGDRIPPANKLFLIADYLEVDARWLASGERQAQANGLVDASSADWIKVPEYDLREMTDESLGRAVVTTPIRRDWLYSTFRASNALWLTRMLSDYQPAGLVEGTLVICRTLPVDDLAEGNVCLWRVAERVVTGRFSVIPDTIPQGGGTAPRDMRYLTPYLDPALGAGHPDLFVPPSAIAKGRYHLVGRILGIMIRPI